eukprot:357881-Chlamydomonas_euryale.AAC.12
MLHAQFIPPILSDNLCLSATYLSLHAYVATSIHPSTPLRSPLACAARLQHHTSRPAAQVKLS